MKKVEIFEGQRFGKLSVVEELEKIILPSKQVNRVVLCKCDCGVEKSIRLLHLVRGRISSCGCLQKTRRGEGKTLLCKVWRSMKDRTKPGYTHGNYSQKNIKLAKEWEDWEVFKSWALSNGYQKGLQIDRIDNDGDYSPSNCRFVSFRDNQNNRDITIFVEYKGKKYPLTVILEEKGLEDSYGTIKSRIQSGWNHEKAIDQPIRKGNYKRKDK
jgi:hypothetical protein